MHCHDFCFLSELECEYQMAFGIALSYALPVITTCPSAFGSGLADVAISMATISLLKSWYRAWRKKTIRVAYF